MSQLARATLTERQRFGTRNGIVLLPAPPAAGRPTMDDVNTLRDDTP